MASTPSIEVSQADIVSINESGQDIQVSQADITSVFNIPALFLQVSSGDITYVSKNINAIQVSQADVLAIVRGRVSDPAIRAWTYTLDGHDFYVLRLGNDETLVYDLATEQWSVYLTGNETYWNVYTGANWVGGNSFVSNFGSNIIVGSDSNGSLFFLDPNKTTDDSAVDGRSAIPFVRRITGQIISRGFDAKPVFEVQLLGSINELAENADSSVELLYSDDRGDSYVSAGTINTVDQQYDIRGSWRSLGSLVGPGRLFRVEDYGALARIDSLTVDLGGADGS